MTRILLRVVLTVALCALAACTAATTGGSTTAPRVYFTSPANNATVSSPLKVTMAADHFTVQPADAGVNAGAGHLHIMVDTPCLAAGQAIPRDDAHVHYGGGQVEAELDLAPGSHTLCLQAADGAHIALEGAGLQQTIMVTVE
jgi:hypothetical protein